MNSLIHKKIGTFSGFCWTDLVAQRSCVKFESHKACKIVKSYDTLYFNYHDYNRCSLCGTITKSNNI